MKCRIYNCISNKNICDDCKKNMELRLEVEIQNVLFKHILDDIHIGELGVIVIKNVKLNKFRDEIMGSIKEVLEVMYSVL